MSKHETNACGATSDDARWLGPPLLFHRAHAGLLREVFHQRIFCEGGLVNDILWQFGMGRRIFTIEYVVSFLIDK